MDWNAVWTLVYAFGLLAASAMLVWVLPEAMLTVADNFRGQWARRHERQGPRRWPRLPGTPGG